MKGETKVMHLSNRKTKLVAGALTLVALAAGWAIWGAHRARAFVMLRESDFGLISLGPGQTARISLVPAVQNNPDGTVNSRQRQVTLGFDVYQLAGRTAAAPDASSFSCITRQFVNRQSCDAMIGPGQAASFDFVAPADGASTQVQPVFTVNGGSFVATVEIREGDRTISLNLLGLNQPGRQ